MYGSYVLGLEEIRDKLVGLFNPAELEYEDNRCFVASGAVWPGSPFRGNMTGMPPPSVTVVVPAYNVASYIREAVESALAQTVSNIEVLVIDDGSTDGTADRLEGFDDPRLMVLWQPNGGLASARNAGIRSASAEFLAFLDGDDLWLPDKLEHHLASFAVHPEADVTYSLSKTIDDNGREIGFIVPHRGGEISYRELLVENVLRNGSAAVLRTRVFEEAGWFDSDLVASTDLDMWLRIAALRPRNIVCIPRSLTLYRRHPAQTTSDWRRMRKAWIQVLEKSRERTPKVVRELESKASSDKHVYFAYIAYEREDYRGALGLLWDSLKMSPLEVLRRIRPWLLFLACISGFILPRAAHRRLIGWGLAFARLVSNTVLFAYDRLDRHSMTKSCAGEERS